MLLANILHKATQAAAVALHAMPLQMHCRASNWPFYSSSPMRAEHKCQDLFAGIPSHRTAHLQCQLQADFPAGALSQACHTRSNPPLYALSPRKLISIYWQMGSCLRSALCSAVAVLAQLGAPPSRNLRIVLWPSGTWDPYPASLTQPSQSWVASLGPNRGIVEPGCAFQLVRSPEPQAAPSEWQLPA